MGEPIKLYCLMITTKQAILKAFDTYSKPLTVNELSLFTGIPIRKIRNRLTTWEYDIIRVCDNTYDLAARVYPGKTFRYTPTAHEIEKGIIRGDDDLCLFLNAASNRNNSITLVDKNEKLHILSYHTSTKHHYSYLGIISQWYKTYMFEDGDDILFTCLDLTTHRFLISREKKSDRDEFIIKIKNRKLADIVFNIINHTISKYESDLFLFRKYLYIYKYNEPIPPDQLVKALANDKRFLISSRDKMLSWTGYRIYDWLTVGLKKYYGQNGSYRIVLWCNNGEYSRMLEYDKRTSYPPTHIS